jgi:hypothetical protein
MGTLYGTWPEPYEVTEDQARGTILLRTPYYEITHDRQQGGAITGIRYPHGSGKNLLLEALRSEVTRLEGTFTDTAEPAPRIALQSSPEEVTLTVEGTLRDAAGKEGGVTYRHLYTYRWGYVRVRKQFHFPADGMAVRRLLVHGGLLRPELGHYGIRPGVPAEASPDPAAFGVCQWGRLRPGAAFDCPYESRFIPRYLVVGDPGREGLEWFVASELAQWDYQITGTPGHGGLWVGPQPQPPGVRLAIAPLHLPRGDARLQGTYTFDFYLGFPILSGRAHRPFLHRSFNRKHWPSEETLRSWAERGVRTAHFHHDGDSFRDGLFWRDGQYPPFGPEDMAEFDRVIDTCHRYGIRVATYFSNKELHPTTEAYRQHGAEWARLPGDRGEQLHNLYSGDEYGAQMCLRSGWRDYLKQYIDTVLTHHALDGVYYDWNVALYCHNPAHTSSDGTAVPPPGNSPPLGALAQSPLGHWDMDELLDLMEWTRRRVGPDGLVIVHNTMVPCAATENFADYVVAMEWGYGQLATAAPPLEDLPLEWNFLGARPRGVIGYGCLTPEAPESVHRQMTLRCLLTGTAPWPAQDLDLEMFAPLLGGDFGRAARGHLAKEDLSTYRFADWRSAAVRLTGHSVAGAVYHRPDAALVLLGNLSGTPQPLRCALQTEALTLRTSSRYRISIAYGGSLEMTLAALTTEGFPATVEGDSLMVVRVVPLEG